MQKKSMPGGHDLRLPQLSSFSLAKTLGLLSLFFAVMISGCKKDDFKGEIVGLCPEVVSTDPMDKAVDVVLNKVLSVTFNTDMKASTINNTTFVIKQGTTVVPGTVGATANGKVFTFKPTSPLLPFTTYTGTISAAVTDTLRTAMVNDYSWSFTTIPQVTVSASPNTSGSVTGGGEFAQGSLTTVSATPFKDFVFTNFTSNGVVVSTSPNYQFTMNGNRTLVANFAPVPVGTFAIIVSSNPAAGGTTSGSGAYPIGSTVTVNAQPNPGYVFNNFTEGGAVVSTNANYQFIIAANRTLVANYTIIPSSQFAIILSSNPVAGGTTSGAGLFNAGSSRTVTATPSTEYTFTSWTENGVVVSTSPSYTFALNSNKTLVANFAINTYTLATTAVNGSVAKNPNQTAYNFGTTVQLTATPNSGYTFTGWSGDASGTTNPLTVVMNTNKNITANFAPIPPSSFTLNVTGANGTVVKNPDQPTYVSGTSVQLTATPNSGYTFSGWSGDASGTANPLTVLMDANKNIVANFTPVIVTPPLFTSIFGAFGGTAGLTNEGINTVINNGAIGTTGVSTIVTGFHDGLTGDVYTETGSNKGLVTGGIYSAPPPPGTAAKFAIATQALAAANAFYISISPANRPGGSDPGAGELGGLTLAPGTYKSAGGTFKITNGNLTLDAQGNPNAVWVFQAPTSLTVGIAGPTGAKSVILKNGAQAQNVYWYVGTAATINGAGGGVMVGNIISTAGVTFSTSGNTVQTVLNGRAISLVASVTMVNTTINVP